MDCVIINDKTYNITVKRYAYPVNEYLCAVAINNGYKIYRLKQGKPFIGTLFATLEDCLGAIKVMYEVYGEYFPIWENDEWQDANIPALAQWSIKNGSSLYDFVKQTEAHGQPIRCSSLYQELA